MIVKTLIHRLIIAIFFISICFGTKSTSAKNLNTLHLNIISSSEMEIILELVVDSFQMETIQQDGHVYQRIIIEQTKQSVVIGEPQVPVYSTLVGLASPENINLQVIESQSVSYYGYEIPVIRSINPIGDNLLDQKASLQVATGPASEFTLSDSYMPIRLAEITQSGYLRDQAFAQITFHPIQYDAEHHEIIFNRRMVVKISSDTPKSSINDNQWNRSEFENTLKNSLINYSDLSRPAAGRPSVIQPATEDQSQSAINLDPELKIVIDQEGMYQLTYDELVNAGFDPSSIDSSNFKLTNQDSEVAILVEDGGDGYIDEPTDRILFFGVGINNIYTNKNVYWLTYSDGNGKRMVEQNGLPGDHPIPGEFLNLLHAEQDTYYWQTMPEGEGQDHWLWGGRLSPNTQGLPVSRTYTVTLENISSTPGLTANIHFELKGGTDIPYFTPDHHTRIYINDQVVDDWYWNGYDILDVNQDISQSEYLIEGDNTIRVECIAVPDALVDQIFVNRFDISYWDTYLAENDRLHFRAPSNDTYKFQIRGFTDQAIQVFDITDPADVGIFSNLIVAPDNGTFMVEFTNNDVTPDRYLAINQSQYLIPLSVELDTPSSWKTPDHGADYLVITYDDFYDNIQPLADFRASQGLRVETVKIQDIYDEFSYGIFSPQAIRDFLIYTYNYWQSPAPLYVLFVGDACIDFKDNYHTGSINFVPSQIVETVASGEMPSDNWFVQITGDDILPDMYIGRLSAQTASQVDAIVGKIIDYDQEQIPSSWATDDIFVADDDDPMFEQDSDAFADLLPSSYTVQKIYVGDYPPGDPSQDLIDNVNAGTMLVNYLGHGDVYRWAQENVLDISSVTLMNNIDMLPFITIESCLNGFFTGSQSSYSLAEALQRHDNGGAVAVWAPSGLSYSNGHKYMISELYKAFYPWGLFGLGQATTLSKWHVYAQNSVWGDMVNTYILFGDPATRLGAKYFNLMFIPAINKAP